MYVTTKHTPLVDQETHGKKASKTSWMKAESIKTGTALPKINKHGEGWSWSMKSRTPVVCDYGVSKFPMKTSRNCVESTQKPISAAFLMGLQSFPFIWRRQNRSSTQLPAAK
ncbi:hypothetical protein M8J77_000102 [Diaphorina citri]|nr:hypothetical protein M8J77_000102 [Diaphorina citri]